jgi:hypothetical protein
MDKCASDHIRRILIFLGFNDLATFLSLNKRCKTLTLRDLPNRTINASTTDSELCTFILLAFIQNPDSFELGMLKQLDDQFDENISDRIFHWPQVLRNQWCSYCHRWAKSYILCKTFTLWPPFVIWTGPTLHRFIAQDLVKLICSRSSTDLCDARDYKNDWYPAKRIAATTTGFLVRFLAWTGNYDEDVSFDHIQALGTFANDYRSRYQRLFEDFEHIDTNFQLELAIAKEISNVRS